MKLLNTIVFILDSYHLSISFSLIESQTTPALTPHFENMANQAIVSYGWTAVPRDIEALLSQSTASGEAKPISASSIKVPDTPLSKAVYEYAKKELAIEPFNHSMRVYYYGMLCCVFQP